MKIILLTITAVCLMVLLSCREAKAIDAARDDVRPVSTADRATVQAAGTRAMHDAAHFRAARMDRAQPVGPPASAASR